MNARERLIEATRELLWNAGYEATSPRDIMERSGVGQGSLYHHFKGKKELAAAVLEQTSGEMIGVGAKALQSEKSAERRLADYLFAQREALKGCRLGRMAYDTAIQEDVLRAPVLHYFVELERLIRETVQEMQEAGRIPTGTAPETLAVTALAVVQGGYILARVHQDARYLQEAVTGLATLLQLPVPDAMPEATGQSE